MPENKNYIVRFGTDVISDTPETDASRTDEELNVEEVLLELEKGVPYGSAAKSETLNSILRQLTAVAWATAQLVHQTKSVKVKSNTKEDSAQLVLDLKAAIEALASGVLTDNLGDGVPSTDALSTTRVKAITEARVAKALKNNLTQTGAGYALDARQGKVLKEIVDAVGETLGDVETTANNVKMRYISGSELKVWKGTQTEYDALQDKTNTLCIIVG